MSTYLAVSIVAFVASVIATWIMIGLAPRWKLTDNPDGHRKLHRQPIALGGGVAVLLGLAAALITAMWIPTTVGQGVSQYAADLVVLLGAGLAIVVIGLIDDRFGLRGRHKLMGQILVAVMLVGSGMIVRRVGLFGTNWELGMLAGPLTVFWLVGAMNALNLIDGVDGLASTVGVILSLSVAAMAMLVSRDTVTLCALAFAFSLLGFLCFNFPPARIFLGDAGSMLIGLIVGALAIRASLKGPATVALAAPLAVWAIPIFDSTAAIVRRKLTGRSIYATDRGHLHHSLLAVFGGNIKVLAVVAVGCAITCSAALVSLYVKSDLLALLGVLVVAAILVSTRIFGHVELLLLANRCQAMGRSLLQPIRRTNRAHHSAVRLQGSLSWDLLWASLTEFAEKFELCRLKLDVNLPSQHEGYNAAWHHDTRRDKSELWTAEIPLFSGGKVIGRLSAAGQVEEGFACEMIERLMDMLQPFEAQLMELAGAAHLTLAAAGEPPIGVHRNPVSPSEELDTVRDVTVPDISAWHGSAYSDRARTVSK